MVILQIVQLQQIQTIVIAVRRSHQRVDVKFRRQGIGQEYT
jgi:hypothetical protein